VESHSKGEEEEEEEGGEDEDGSGGERAWSEENERRRIEMWEAERKGKSSICGRARSTKGRARAASIFFSSTTLGDILHSALSFFFFASAFSPLFLPFPNRFKMAPAGIAVGLNKGHVVTKVEKTARPAARKGVSVTCWKNRRGAASTSDGG
jgi:hypothetical protein